jgi:hypothetical protein
MIQKEKFMWREFRLKKGARTQVWKIRQLGESYETEHGILDGKQQTHSDTPGSKGKEGTKAFVTAEDNCKFHLLREIRFKQESGYIEYVDGKPSAKQIDSIDFNNYLPKNFCAYKPKALDKPETVEKIHNSGKAYYTRKIDGMMTIFAHHPWGWEAYTRRLDLTTDRVPEHI